MVLEQELYYFDRLMKLKDHHQKGQDKKPLKFIVDPDNQRDSITSLLSRISSVETLTWESRIL